MDRAADDLEADARALSSVLRLRILRLCLDEPRTNKEIADRLGRDPATILHHVRTLAARGFLVAQEPRRGNRGAREVPYLATRKSWHVPKVPGQDRIIVDAFLEEAAEADPASLTAGRLGLRLRPEGWAEFTERLDALLDEFARRPADPDGTAYSVFVAYHEDAGRRPRPEPGGEPEPDGEPEPGGEPAPGEPQ